MPHKETVEQIENKKYHGYKINVYQDDINESPEDWGDDGVFLVGYHRDFWVTCERKNYKTGEIIDRGYTARAGLVT